MKGSLGHLTRGAGRAADVLLVVTEPSYRSPERSGGIGAPPRELGLGHARGEAAIREVIGCMPCDERVAEPDRPGRAPINPRPTGPAVLVERLGRPVAAGR